MRLASFAHNGQERFGAVTDDGIVDLGKKLSGDLQTLRDLLDRNAMGEAMAATAGSHADYGLDEITWRLPVPEPEKIFCVGQNYAAHIQEMGYKIPEWPSIFSRFPRSFVAHEGSMVMPGHSEQFDYEGELTVVIGKTARAVSEDDALDYVAGYTICNDGSVRDWQRRGPQVAPGKNWENSGMLGPWITTADEIADPGKLDLVTRVNGEERQHGHTSDLVFSVPFLISYISTYITLVPGDMITTGSPHGVASGFDPPRWLKPGDRVEIEIERIGALRASIAVG